VAAGSRAGDPPRHRRPRRPFRRRPGAPAPPQTRVEVAPGKRIVYPGTFSPTPTLLLVRDTSGSVSDADLELVTSEVVGIAKGIGIRGRDLRIMDVDAAVQHTRDYNPAADLGTIQGRGGTDMRIGIQVTLDLKPRPLAVVVFTDGETPWPDNKLPVPLLVCQVGTVPTEQQNTRRSGRSPLWWTRSVERSSIIRTVQSTPEVAIAGRQA
jgi:hypothetical protein